MREIRFRSSFKKITEVDFKLINKITCDYTNIFTFKWTVLLFKCSAATIFFCSKDRIFFSIHNSREQKFTHLLSLVNYLLCQNCLTLKYPCFHCYIYPLGSHLVKKIWQIECFNIANFIAYLCLK